jgi:hypothetical protein
MSKLKYEKFFFIGIAGTLLPIAGGYTLLAIHGMLVLIMFVLMGIMRFLLENNR